MYITVLVKCPVFFGPVSVGWFVLFLSCRIVRFSKNIFWIQVLYHVCVYRYCLQVCSQPSAFLVSFKNISVYIVVRDFVWWGGCFSFCLISCEVRVKFFFFLIIWILNCSSTFHAPVELLGLLYCRSIDYI